MEQTSAATQPSEIDVLAADARRKARTAIARQQRLIKNLESDLEKHGDPELWKRFGDLILANISNAKRVGDRIAVTDYFDPVTPEIDIKGDANKELSEIAEDYFARYTKARNGRAVINERMKSAEVALRQHQEKLAEIDAAAKAGDIQFLRALIQPAKQKVVSRPSKRVDQTFKGARRFLSSEGYEIFVGKKAADNDFLTFRVARSLDLWLHAADYPGSHVVVRSSGKKPVPDRTLLEAAQLAAFYSDAREQPKAAVRYTQKKFVNRVKGGAPGLVRLASFRTLMVEPKVAVEPILPR